MYRWFALLAIGVVMSVYGLILDYMSKNTNNSISQHIARHKTFFWIAATALISYGGLMYMFFTRWLVPTLHLPYSFTVLVWLATVATVITALVPDNDNAIHRRIHRIAAYGLACISHAMVMWILFTAELSLLLRIWASVAALYMLYAGVAYIFVPALRKYYLAHQIVYALAYYSLLIAISFCA